MRSKTASFLILLVLALPAALSAQQADPDYDWFGSRLKIRGHHVYNRSAVDAENRELAEGKTGYGAGLEYVGARIGVSLSGYTVGQVREFNSDSSSVVVLLETNYYLPIRALRLAPYAGIHTGLGAFSKAYFSDPFLPRPRDSRIGDLGYQFGVRWQPFDLLGVDLQHRRISASATAAQSAEFERRQVLMGITIF